MDKPKFNRMKKALGRNVILPETATESELWFVWNNLTAAIQQEYLTSIRAEPAAEVEIPPL